MRRFAYWFLLTFAVSFIISNDVFASTGNTPSESECRPYIEKAISELKTGDAVEKASDSPSEENNDDDTTTSPYDSNENIINDEPNDMQSDQPTIDEESQDHIDDDSGVDSSKSIDLDGDGIPNEEDNDIDGDVIPNDQDDDMDGDGIPNVLDDDIDGDVIPNEKDLDMDGDGVLNVFDRDIDGDGVPNVADSDLDGDGVPNVVDSDIDGDGVTNINDNDIDGDGIPNDEDDDIDGDGIPNDEDDDIDGDGIPNSEDDDMDGDGIPNDEDDDIDGDGIPNDEDDDIDGDGVPNKEDFDVDGDGVPNEQEEHVNEDETDSQQDTDIDGDGIPNEQDNDIDGDGVSNELDHDLDGDGIHNDDDNDTDGDGIPNDSDHDIDGDGLPNDEEPKSADIDGDGIPNDDDNDIDGDVIPNELDDDMDGDGIPNAHDRDIDGDGIPNVHDEDSQEAEVKQEETASAEQEPEQTDAEKESAEEVEEVEQEPEEAEAQEEVGSRAKRSVSESNEVTSSEDATADDGEESTVEASEEATNVDEKIETDDGEKEDEGDQDATDDNAGDEETVPEEEEEVAESEAPQEEEEKEQADDVQDAPEAASEEDDDTKPEDELLWEGEIPDRRRSRDHITELLQLAEENNAREEAIDGVADTILKDIKRIYENAIKPLETLYKYRDLSNRHFGDPEIFSKPLVLFMGPWSGGKSTTVNYLTDNEYTPVSLRTGAEPSPAYFNILMWGNETEVLDGTQLAADYTFSGLQKFGQGLEDRLRGLKIPNKLLEKINIVEIPGILEVRKQVSRLFPFNDACQWFIDRADIIFLVYDPAKLDVGPETEAILDQLKGREYQTRIVLNKADTVKPEELLRVQSALIWNISPLMSSAQPPLMYTTSLWSHPYQEGAPARLLLAQERAFLRDLRTAVDKRIEHKIASARRFAVRVRNHAKMVDCYLNTYYNHKTLFGNKKRIADDITHHPQNYHIYEGLSTLTNISRYDLPDPEVYRDFFRLNPLYEFKKLTETCTYFRGCPISKLDLAIAYELPELAGKYKKLSESRLAAVGQPDDTNAHPADNVQKS